LSSALQARSEIGRPNDHETSDENKVFAVPARHPRLENRKGRFHRLRQKKYGYSKDLLEEAYKYLVNALSQDGFVDDRALRAAIDEAKTLAKITKPINQLEVVDYSFLRVAVKNDPRILSCESGT
jgi:excinuclease UvrABC nuclease subunit